MLDLSLVYAKAIPEMLVFVDFGVLVWTRLNKTNPNPFLIASD